MKLGDVVQISLGVPDLAESVAFYEKLGFIKLLPTSSHGRGRSFPTAVTSFYSTRMAIFTQDCLTFPPTWRRKWLRLRQKGFRF